MTSNQQGHAQEDFRKALVGLQFPLSRGQVGKGFRWEQINVEPAGSGMDAAR